MASILLSRLAADPSCSGRSRKRRTERGNSLRGGPDALSSTRRMAVRMPREQPIISKSASDNLTSCQSHCSSALASIAGEGAGCPRRFAARKNSFVASTKIRRGGGREERWKNSEHGARHWYGSQDKWEEKREEGGRRRGRRGRVRAGGRSSNDDHAHGEEANHTGAGKPRTREGTCRLDDGKGARWLRVEPQLWRGNHNRCSAINTVPCQAFGNRD